MVGDIMDYVDLPHTHTHTHTHKHTHTHTHTQHNTHEQQHTHTHTQSWALTGWGGMMCLGRVALGRHYVCVCVK